MSLLRLLAAAALVAGCGFDSSGSAGGGDGGPGGDGDPDANPGPDAEPDICDTWLPAAPFDPCAAEEREAELVLGGSVTYTFDTTDGTWTASSGDPPSLPGQLIAGGEIRLLSVGRFEMGTDAVLRVVGDVPLLVASWGVIEMRGLIDASSSAAGDGAGANHADCPMNLTGAFNVAGGGGGGGGGFGIEGGSGGVGTTAGGGRAGAVAAAGTLRGGCPGGQGGSNELDGPRTPGGSGGGAVALSARFTLSVEGTIHVGGAGGAGGRSAVDVDLATGGNGGGGGGSGGMIWLDAPTITLPSGARLLARGGGGGEGGDLNEDGDPGDAASPAGGRTAEGSGSSNRGGDGGRSEPDNGDTPAEDGDPGQNNEGGGGGGGGGGGVIRLSGEVDSSALVRPPAETE